MPVRTSRVVSFDDLRDRLAETGARLRADVRLAELTTLRVGGPATVAECASTDALVATVRELDAAGIPVLLIAGGSNLLIGDDGFDGVVVRIATRAVEFTADSVIAEAGANWDAVVAASVEAGFGGLECLSGIPGSAGATPVQNVGAYGVEVASLLRRVRLLDRATGEIRWVEPGELGFGYRTSVLKHSAAAVVLAVEFALRADGSSAPLGYRELANALGAAEGSRVRPRWYGRPCCVCGRVRAWSSIRTITTPGVPAVFHQLVIPDAQVAAVRAAISSRVGADVAVPTFPAAGGVKFSAGWLIERAGFAKGFPGDGSPARLSTKHTLALTNRGAATATDLVTLARTVRDGVAERFGIRLEPEPVTVGVSL